jgi:hypothetical protein
MRNTIQHPTRGRLVCKIWDNGGETIDRYTIGFKMRAAGPGMRYWPYLAASENPFHPLGFGQYGEWARWYDAKGGKHLGKRIPFEALPDAVQQFVMQSI